MNQRTICFQSETQPISDDFLKKVKSLAEEHGIQVEDECDDHLLRKQQKAALEFIQEADRLARSMPYQTIDSADIIREERDRW